MKTAEGLLRSKEAQGLVWSMSARITFCLVVIALHIRDAVGLLLFSSVIAFAAYCIHLARQERHLLRIGLAGIGFDLFLISMIVFLLQRNFVAAAAPPALVLKTGMIFAMINLIVINAMALRPLYPALVATGFFVIQVAVIAFSLQQQGVVVTSDPIEAMSTAAIDRDRLVGDTATIVIVGFFLTAMSHAARKLVRNVVELELRNQRIVKEQARLLMDFRMAGLANLVAGVAHELNTPLGASMSSANTVETCANKLGTRIESAHDNLALKQDSKVQRLLGILGDASHVIKDAGKRMSSAVHSLKNFSRLDEAEVQKSDIRAGLKSALALITEDARGDVHIVENYEDIRIVKCRPKELNQVFLSLLLHSFQAMKGRGTLYLDVRDEDETITITIRDTSEGMPESLRKGLFEIGFAKKGMRMGMDLELPTAKFVVEQHGGGITVESEIGKGTSFVIHLPIGGIESNDSTSDSNIKRGNP